MEAHTIPIAATPVLRELAPAVGTGVEGIDAGVEGIDAGAVGVATGGAVGTYTGQLLHQVFSKYLDLRQAGREQRVQQMLIHEREGHCRRLVLQPGKMTAPKQTRREGQW